MKTCKTILSLLLVLSLVLPLAACQKNATPAQALYESFCELSGPDADLQQVAEQLLGELPFSGVSVGVEEGELLGFTRPIAGFSEGVVFAPMIGAIPFLGYLFRLDEGQNPEEFIRTLEQAADLRWNVCTQAEEIVTGRMGNTVFFAMSPRSFEE